MTYEVLDYLKKSGQAIKIQAKASIKFKIYRKSDENKQINMIYLLRIASYLFDLFKTETIKNLFICILSHVDKLETKLLKTDLKNL